MTKYTSFLTTTAEERRDGEKFSDYGGGSWDRTGVHQAGYNTVTRETEMLEISELWSVVLTVSQADVD